MPIPKTTQTYGALRPEGGIAGVARVLTLNLWGEQAPLERRLQLAVEGMRALAPDVIALQEVREIPGQLANTATTIARELGFESCFAGATDWGGGTEGLALLSRWPIKGYRAKELPHAIPAERRVVLGASITAPDGDLAVFTTHLNYRLGDGLKREDQVGAVDEFVTGWPSELPKIVMGDFNAAPDSDEIRFLRGKHTLHGRRAVYQDAWERRGLSAVDAGWTWAARNPYTQRLRWLETDRRIDYVFVTPMQRDGRGVIHDCRVVFDRPAADGAYPSDHFGLYAEVQLAPLP